MRTRHILAAFVPVTSWLADREALNWGVTGHSYREDADEAYIAAAEYISAHGIGSGLLVLGERDKWCKVSIKYSGTAHKDWEAVNLDHIQIALCLYDMDKYVEGVIEDEAIMSAIWRCMTHVNMTPDELRTAILELCAKVESLGVERGDWTYNCIEKAMRRRLQV